MTGMLDRISSLGEEAGGKLSRRAFLAGTMAVTVGGAERAVERAGLASRSASGPPVLTVDDLVGGSSYVEWRVDPADAPLSSALDLAVSAFTPADGTVAAFLATASADGPRSVESAIFPANGFADALVAATDDWVGQEHTGTTTRTAHGADAVSWMTVSGSNVDAIRVEILPSGHLGVIAASGSRETQLDPETAVQRYASVVRPRAEARLSEDDT